MQLTLRRWFAFCILGVSSCTSTATQRDALQLIFITESDPGVSLSGVSVWVDGSFVGSSVDGGMEAHLGFASERTVRIRHDCPEGHQDPVGDRILRVSPFSEIGAEARGMEVTLRCPPKQHIGGFVVRGTNAPSLPVLLDGVEVARTNRLGVAHFSRRGEAGTKYTIQLDTSSNSRLVPQHPTRIFSLGDQHEIFVIDQAFELARNRRRKPRRKPRIIRIE
jgi:hypothetical protein